MDTKTSAQNGVSKDWLKTIGVAAVCTALYAGTLAFTADHSKIGNAVLAVLSVLGIGASFYLMNKLHDIFGPDSWDVLWKTWRRMTWIFFLSSIGHIVGAFFVSAIDAQIWLAYAPLMIFAALLVLRFIKFLMEDKKARDRER